MLRLKTPLMDPLILGRRRTEVPLFPRPPWLREPEARNPLNGKHLMKELPSDYISQNSYDDAIDRRGFLKCMASMLLISKRADWVLLGRNNSTCLKKT